jgi:hypothetical protein
MICSDSVPVSRFNWIFVYPSVVRTGLWPAIFDASMLETAHILPPSDIDATEGVWSENGSVESNVSPKHVWTPLPGRRWPVYADAAFFKTNSFT